MPRTMPPANLKLADLDQPLVFRFERRAGERKPRPGRATLVQTGPGASTDRRIRALDLLDVSPTGLGGVAQEPIAVDAFVCVHMPRQPGAWNAPVFGRVVRCDKRPDGRYDVGVMFDRRPAA